MRTKTLPTVPSAPRRSYLPLVLTALIGVGLALYRFGFHVLNPANIHWFRGDSVGYFLAWHFFRREPWGIPPGQINGLLAPLGTSIGSADALPLLAFPLKLFSAALPTDFQYLGLWLFICYALQSVFGYLLARTFCKNRWLALVIGLFFLFSPVMIFRAGHIALSAHWILLFALWHYLRTAKEPSFRLYPYAGVWLLIVALVGLIHPYLAAMVFPIAFVSLLREYAFSKRLKLIPGLGLLVGMSGVLALEWWLSGLLGSGQSLAKWGFDYFSMNLNALFNPSIYSRVLPPLPLGGGQYEGFMYLGLGVIGLSVVGLVAALRRGPWRGLRRASRRLYATGHLPLALVALGFFLYALGKIVTLGQGELFEFGLFTNFGTLTGVFRAPGRFFWPVFYLFYISIFAYLVRRFPPRTAVLLLGTGLLVQVYDLKLNFPFVETPLLFSRNLQDNRWEELIAPFKTIAVIPALELTTANRGDYAEFAYLAGIHAKRITTGNAARISLDSDIAKEQLEDEAVLGPRRLDTLYVFSAVKFAQHYLTKLEPGLRCYELGDYVACHSDKRDLGFGPELNLSSYLPAGYKRVSLADYLARHDDQTVVLVAEGGVGRILGDAENVLVKRGSSGRLAPEAAYAAVLHHGRVVFELNSNLVESDSGSGASIEAGLGDSDLTGSDPDDTAPANSDSVRRHWNINAVLGENVGEDRNPLVLPKTLHISGTASVEKNAYVVVGGVPAFKTERGVNVVVFDRQLEVVTAANFDTQVTFEGVVEVE